MSRGVVMTLAGLHCQWLRGVVVVDGRPQPQWTTRRGEATELESFGDAGDLAERLRMEGHSCSAVVVVRPRAVIGRESREDRIEAGCQERLRQYHESLERMHLA